MSNSFIVILHTGRFLRRHCRFAGSNLAHRESFSNFFYLKYINTQVVCRVCNYCSSLFSQLLCVFPERTSRVCAAACAAASRVGGEARAVRGPRDALEALRRDSDARPPHVVVVDARQPQLMDAGLLAK